MGPKAPLYTQSTLLIRARMRHRGLRQPKLRLSLPPDFLGKWSIQSGWFFLPRIAAGSSVGSPVEGKKGRAEALSSYLENFFQFCGQKKHTR